METTLKSILRYSETINELKLKLAIYDGEYTFEDANVSITLEDGNNYRAHKVFIYEDGNIGFLLYSVYVGYFSVDTTSLDEGNEECVNHLEELCDSIPAPKELTIELLKDGQIVGSIFSKAVNPNWTCDNLYDFLKANFAAYKWTPDPANDIAFNADETGLGGITLNAIVYDE